LVETETDKILGSEIVILADSMQLFASLTTTV